MSIHFDERASSTATNKPQGHFDEPSAVDPNQFTVLYFSGKPGPEYWICVVRVEKIITPGKKLEILVFKTNGHFGPNKVDVDLDDIRQVWRATPSTVDQKLNPPQAPLAVGNCLVLCLSEERVAAAGITSSQESFGKHPWGGDDDGDVYKAFREMARRLGPDVDSLESTRRAKAKYPNLFR